VLPTPDAGVAAHEAGASEGPLEGRTWLGEARATPLEVAVLPASRGALLVSDAPGDEAAAARRIDDEGELGPPILLRGEHVAAVLTGADDRFTLVTSKAASLCVATYREGSAVPEGRGCADVAPVAAALVGDRIALVEAVQEKPPEPPPEPTPRKRKAKKKKKTSRAKPAHESSKKRDARPSRRPARDTAKPKVEVSLRFVTREGVFDAEAKPIGLRFERPLEGMTVLAANGRGGGVDLAWYEFAGHHKKGSGPLGSARLVAGTIGADGKLDSASRVVVYEGPLDWAGIGDHRSPHLYTTEQGSVYVGLDKDKGCEATRVLPSFARLAPDPRVCAVDPRRLADPKPVSADELAAFARILEDGPRRVVGQPKSDLEVVAWAGARAYWLQAGALRSAARGDGVAREEPSAMAGMRARLRWGAVARDGEALALVADRLVHAPAAGPIEASPLPRSAESPLFVTPTEADVDRPRLVRIGSTWWRARGSLVRVHPDLGKPLFAGRAHPDTSALVGGEKRGLFVELAGHRLTVTPFEPGGPSADRVPVILGSPVRAGFDAVSRRGGGAVVAGVDVRDPAKVVAFALDGDARVSPPHPTSLTLRPGDFDVRLVALPQGGAVLSDPARTVAVWLDDDGRELGHGDWPSERASAACADGVPARVFVPSPEPGRFVRVPELADAGTCVLGDPVWATDGTLRWLGSHAEGLDARAELGKVRVDGISAPPSRAGGPVGTTDAPSAAERMPPEPVCPGDMVSIAGRYCVDRFEASLVDARTGAPVPPDFPTSRGFFELAVAQWATGRERAGDLHARAFPMPFSPVTPTHGAVRAVSRFGVRPNGYLSGNAAEAACTEAGKRLCTRDEFVDACRGEDDTAFPYGDDFVAGVCNVDRDEHPAATLHGNASVGHLDPRLNRVVAKDGPLLRTTGATPACRSRWGDDAVYDMVGNLDEWVTDPSGFSGGFYSRATRSGCDASITTHPKPYLDYSLGVRCCKDPAPPSTAREARRERTAPPSGG
jgi:hypothetical protein